MALLYDQLVRHQIYLEGYKAFQGAKFDAAAKKLEKLFRNAVNNLDQDSFDKLSRTKLNALIKELRKKQLAIHNEYQKTLQADIRKFAKADHKLLSDIAEKSRAVETSLLNRALSNPIPGVGLPIDKFSVNVGYSQIVNAEKLFNQAKANAWTKKELLDKLLGEKISDIKKQVKAVPRISTAERLQTTVKASEVSKVKADGKPDAVKLKVPVAENVGRTGGLLNRLRSESQSAVNTIIQHLSSEMAADILEEVSNKYQWISVLDSATSEICRSRSLKVYEHGQGPLPPAHINCRSHIIPYVDNA